jgi:hypothetical protein
MWLINTHTFELKFVFAEDAPPYAILSHRWEDEEITFQEMNLKGNGNKEKGYKKVVDFCEIARADGYDYGWVDTCWLVTDLDW